MGSNVGAVRPTPEIPEGLWMQDDQLVFECRNCGQVTVWDAPPEDFELCNAANVCGRSERCIP